MADRPGGLSRRAAAVSDLDSLAGLLRELREGQAPGAALSYRELAAHTGWSRSTVGAYLSGRALPPADRFDRLAILLGATAEERRHLTAARDRLDEVRSRRATGITRAAPRQVPGDVPAFTGRAVALTALDLLFARGEASPAATVAVVSGAAGVGKTALVLHWAHRACTQFPDGQLFVNLRGFDCSGQLVSAEDALRGFLGALGITGGQTPATEGAMVNAYRSLLANKRVLVVLDNAVSAEQVRPLLPTAPGCAALITSRDELRSLVVTASAHPVVLGTLSGIEAADLLARRLGSERAAADPAAVEDIAVACARLPLALVIAAARAAIAPTLPLATLARQLRTAGGRRLDALDAGEAVADVRTVFSWSYQRLSPAAAQLFRLMGVHPGPDLAVPAAASLAATTPGALREPLAELTRAHLVEQHLRGRYTFHDLLRAYAADLAAAEAPEKRLSALRRGLDHYLHGAYRAATALNPHRSLIELNGAERGVVHQPITGSVEARTWLDTEYPNVRAALEAAAATGQHAHTWRLAWTLADFLHSRNSWHDEEATQRAGLLAARRLGNHDWEARSRRYLGRARAHLGDYTEALSHLHAAIHLSNRVGAGVGAAHAHLNIAWILDRQGESGAALRHTEDALELFKVADHRAGVQCALNGLGWHYSRLGQHARSLETCMEALRLARELQDPLREACTLDSIGRAHHDLGQYCQAAAFFTEALSLFRDRGNHYLEADVLTHLGDNAAALGAYDTAHEHWRQAVTLLSGLGHPDGGRLQERLDQLVSGAVGFQSQVDAV